MILILHLDLDNSFADTIAAGHFHAGTVQLTGEEEDEPPFAQSRTAAARRKRCFKKSAPCR